MKAIQVLAAGGPETLRVAEVPTPEAGPGEIRVRVVIAGVNFADTMMRRDAYFLPVAFPLVPGAEVAGVVDSVGPGVVGFAPGDRVAGLLLEGRGGYAQFAVLPASHAARAPDGLDFARGSAVLNQGATAQGLIEAAPEIAAGASVLVTAAAGGVGGLLVQLARLSGAGQVLAAAGGADKLADLAAAGVATISYADPQWFRAVRAATGGRGADVIFDAVGGAVREVAVKALSARGRIVYYGAASGSPGVTDAFLSQMMGKSASLTGYAIHTSIAEDPAWLGQTLTRLFDLAATGRLATPIHPPFPLGGAAEAHRALEGRGTRGKLLIEIAPEDEQDAR